MLAGFVIAREAGKPESPKLGRKKLVELGSGCGAALLACALRADFACLGIEREASLIDCARKNAALLGLDGRAAFARADLAKKGFFRDFPLWQGQCGLAMANPPWRSRGAGPAPESALRRKALCAEKGGLELFCRRASGFLLARGRFYCILPPALLPEFLLAASAADLGLRLVLPVASHAGEKARRLLLMCGKNMRAEPELAAQLDLHQDEAAKSGWTSRALAFCPWLSQT